MSVTARAVVTALVCAVIVAGAVLTARLTVAQQASNDQQTSIAVKKVIGLDPRSKDNAFPNETVGGGINVHTSDVWSDAINSTPATCVSAGVCDDQYVTTAITLTEDTTVNDQKGWCAVTSGTCVEANRIRGWIPPKFGSDYTVVLYENDGTTVVPPLDEITWYWDYEAGYLSIENDPNTTTDRCDGACSMPFKLKAYVYIGDTADTSLTNIDISDDTNLAVTAPIVLTDDTLSLDQTNLEEEAHCSEHDSADVDCSGETIVYAANSINEDELASSITFGAFDNIVLPIEASDQTTDGEIDYDSTEEVIEVGDDGVSTLKFYPGAHTTEVNDLSAAVTWANVPDANVDGANERDEVCGTTDLSATCELNDDIIVESNLNAIDAPADGEFLTYNLAGTNFEWDTGPTGATGPVGPTGATGVGFPSDPASCIDPAWDDKEFTCVYDQDQDGTQHCLEPVTDVSCVAGEAIYVSSDVTDALKCAQNIYYQGGTDILIYDNTLDTYTQQECDETSNECTWSMIETDDFGVPDGKDWNFKNHHGAFTWDACSDGTCTTEEQDTSKFLDHLQIGTSGNPKDLHVEGTIYGDIADAGGGFMAAGNDSDKDLTMTFDLLDAGSGDQTFMWDESEDAFAVSNDFQITGSITASSLNTCTGLQTNASGLVSCSLSTPCSGNVGDVQFAGAGSSHDSANNFYYANPTLSVPALDLGTSSLFDSDVYVDTKDEKFQIEGIVSATYPTRISFGGATEPYPGEVYACGTHALDIECDGDVVAQQALSVQGASSYAADVTLVSGADLILSENSVLEIDELASAEADVAGYGQFWVKNDTPNSVYFTDDAGNDQFIGSAFAEISATDNTTVTSVAASSTPYQITIFDTNGESLVDTPDHTNDHITITNAGTYLITVSMTIESESGAGFKIDCKVEKNNGATDVGSLHFHRNLSGGGGDVGSASMSGFAALSASDTVEVWCSNDSNTTDFTVEDITLSILRVK